MNEPHASQCTVCGTPLPVAVPATADDDQPDQPRTTVSLPKKTAALPQVRTLLLMVAGYSRPIHVHRQRQTILGRSTPDGTSPDVDLTEYNALSMGVSRHHARVFFEGNQCFVEDLGSSNGTRVNGEPLEPHKPHPIRDGDQITLGMLVLLAFFSAVDSIMLRKVGVTTDHYDQMTPAFLAHTLAPFLERLANIQHIIDRLYGRDPAEVTVNSITVAATQRWTVKLVGAVDAIDIVKQGLSPAMLRHADLLAKTGRIAAQNGDTSGETNGARQEVLLRASVDGIVKALFRTTKPPLTKNEVERVAAELLQHLWGLVDSRLIIEDPTAHT